MEIINAEKFNSIRNDGKIVVDFFADWCGPCKMLGPVMEEVSKDHDDITFVKVNVDDEEDLAREFGIMSIPAVFMLNNGEVKNKFLGYIGKEAVEEEINKAFK